MFGDKDNFVEGATVTALVDLGRGLFGAKVRQGSKGRIVGINTGLFRTSYNVRFDNGKLIDCEPTQITTRKMKFLR